MNAMQTLKEWADRYARNKAIAAGITKVEEKGNMLLVRKNEGTDTYIIELTFNPKSTMENATIVTLSNPDNIGIVVKNWETVSKIKGLKIIFANPLSTQEERWIIMPYVHNRICDRKSLKLGLTAMAELVDPITEKEIEAR
jgi:hypothetical protein